ncbi:MAG TPA: ChaN family lipoprotein [Usitatibacter sp.]|nr:ChaN family lipoprotein [Usitatibacter sp.]
MNRIRAALRSARALAALLLLAGCAPAGAGGAAPLAGRIWDVAAHRFVGAGEVERRLAAADVALLGETHDNPSQHGIQLRLLRAAVAAGRRPALAMEQIDTEWQDAVDRALASGGDASAVEHAGHVSAGWKWPLYAPIVSFAIGERLPVVALNLPRERTRRIVGEGLASLGPGEAARLALDRTWSDARNAELRRDIVEGHCGEDSPIVDRLVEVQRAKDAVMADRILAHDGRGVVAILGRGHARADLAVPLYLAARAPRLRLLIIGLVEVDPDAARVDDYPEVAPGRFDFVWFTTRAERGDPCAGFKGVPAGR